MPHQEAVLKSLMKIRDAVGEDEFESYLMDYDDNMKKNIEVLSKIYNIKSCKKRQRENQDIMKTDKDKTYWDSDSDTSGIAEEEDEAPNGTMPPARVVLETEIKFNEETAITMTILEEKNDDSDDEQDIVEAGGDVKDATDVLEEDKRKTPRRVHFGGEIVKLRTPDSDETESIEIAPKTRIPLPVSPATKMPDRIRRRPSSQPCSPHAEKRKSKRASRSASSSPKRDAYTHNAQLSPKKSILTRTATPVIIIDSAVEEAKNTKNSAKEKKSGEMIMEDESFRAINSSQEINEISAKDTSIQATPSSTNNGLTKINERKCAKGENDMPESIQVTNTEDSNNISLKEEQTIAERNNHEDVINSNRNDEAPAKQAKDYTSTELSSPERKTRRENRNISEMKDDSLGSKRVRLNEQKESDLSCDLMTDSDKNGFPFGSPINECNTRIDRLVGGDFIDDGHDVLELITGDQSVSRANDIESYVVDSDDERRSRSSQRDRKSASETNGNITCSSSEGEGKPQEPNWEELGLVDQDVLDDLHNKVGGHARTLVFGSLFGSLTNI